MTSRTLILRRSKMRTHCSCFKALNRLRKNRIHLSARLRQGLAVAVATAFTFAPIVSGPMTIRSEAKAISLSGVTAGDPSGSCTRKSAHGQIQHVIYVQFDNTHFTRDNPNVPSDLEQMPNLLNFIENNGVLLSNHHTPLISHTATDILTSLTGVYGDNHGVPVSNSFRYFNPNGTTNPGVSFAYWTDPIYDFST